MEIPNGKSAIRRPSGIAVYKNRRKAPHHHFAFLISNFSFKRSFRLESKDGTPQRLTLNLFLFYNEESMRFSKGFFSLLLFLAAGALIGGILGQVLGSANLVGLMPFLTETYEIFHIQNIALNLGIMQIHFGIRFAPNLISILGILVAWWLYEKF